MNAAPDLLVVDDTRSELELIELAHEANGSRYSMRMFAGGALAWDWLQACVHEPDRPAALPSLLLLDLNMPGLSGLELLARVRADLRLRALPVVIFSASSLSADRDEALRLGADSYLRKPLGFKELCALLVQIEGDWHLADCRPAAAGQ